MPGFPLLLLLAGCAAPCPGERVYREMECSGHIVREACQYIGGSDDEVSIGALAAVLSTSAESLGLAPLRLQGTAVRCADLCTRIVGAMPAQLRPPGHDIAARVVAGGGLAWDVDVSAGELLDLTVDDVKAVYPDMPEGDIQGALQMLNPQRRALLVPMDLQAEMGDEVAWVERLLPRQVDPAVLLEDLAALFRLYPAPAAPLGGLVGEGQRPKEPEYRAGGAPYAMEAVAACTALADCVAARAWMATVVKQIRAAQPPAVVDKWFGVKRAPQPDRVLGFIGKRLWLARQQLARAYLARLSAEDSGCEGRTTAFVVARTITEIKSWDASSPRLEGGAGAPLRLFDGVAPPQRVLGLQVLQDEAPSIEGFVVQQVGFGKWWALKWDSLRRASPGELAAELRGKKVVLELFPDPGDGEELQPLYRINACPSLDVVPRARRLAVLAHEALHHYPAGVEHAGGPVTNELDSEQLAKKRPGLALDNAPNFQYMIENLLHFMPVPEEG